MSVAEVGNKYNGDGTANSVKLPNEVFVHPERAGYPLIKSRDEDLSWKKKN